MNGNEDALHKISSLLIEAESQVFNKLVYTTYYVHVDAEERKRVAKRIVKSAALMKKYGIVSPEFLSRIHFLARCIVQYDANDNDDYIFGIAKMSPQLISDIREIAEEARVLSKSTKETTIAKRLKTNRLFQVRQWTMAAQIIQPHRGCSASICSNCYEPTGFCENRCCNCGYLFVGPFEMPTVQEWDKMKPQEKIRKVLEVYANEPNHGRLLSY